MLQHSGLDIDLDRTLAAHEACAADWERAVAREAHFIEELGPAPARQPLPRRLRSRAREHRSRERGLYWIARGDRLSK
jgi:hypothetical protein